MRGFNLLRTPSPVGTSGPNGLGRLLGNPAKWLSKTRGVHPADHKQESLQLPIGDLTSHIGSKDPQHNFQYLYVPMSDISGMPLRSNFKIGDKVLGGQLANQVRNINERQYLIPTSGEIVGMEDVLISGRVPYHSKCLKIKADGKQQLLCPEENDCVEDYHNCSQDEIINRIRKAAIYGMGGGGFPTWRKIITGNIKHLIINAVECEPYITVDHALIESRSDEIISAISVLQELIQKYDVSQSDTADKKDKLVTYIAMEDNMQSAIDKLQAALDASQLENTYIKVQPTVYPAGSEKQLVYELLGREIPIGQVAAQQGILSLNIATTHAIYRALVHNMPLLQRIVTVSGNGVEQPRNYWVQIGTPIKDIIKYVRGDGDIKGNGSGQNGGGKSNGGDPDDLQVYLGGGMMNYRVHDTNMPISSSTNCILLFSGVDASKADNDLLYKSNTGKNNSQALPQLDRYITNHRECIRCGLCEQICPVHLLPQNLYRDIKASKFKLAEEDNLSSCIECAACDYVCPSNIPLSEYYTFAKEHIRLEKQNTLKSDRARDRFNEHKARIEKEKLAQQARREARRAAMKQVNKESPPDEQEVKQRKIASMKIQIEKTTQAIDKWRTAGAGVVEGAGGDDKGENNSDDKIPALEEALDKLKKELQELESSPKQ